jgi:hypothetical protein
MSRVKKLRQVAKITVGSEWIDSRSEIQGRCISYLCNYGSGSLGGGGDSCGCFGNSKLIL